MLSRVELERISLRASMEDYFRANKRLEPIKGLARAYALGVLRKYRLLDLLAERLLGVEICSLRAKDRNLLRALLYEAKYRQVDLDRVVRVARALRGPRLERRDFELVKRCSVRELLKGMGELERLSVEYSQPLWVVRYLVGLLGKAEALRLLRKFNQRHARWIRANILRTTPEALASALRRRGVEVARDEDLEDVLKVLSPLNLSRLPEYKAGLFYIQDKASALVSHVLRPEPGESILDACAAPGSKALHAASLARDRVLLVAVDWRPSRLAILRRSASRLGVRSVNPISADSRMPPLRGKFDKVLVDPDCTSLGRLGHSPEIRLWLSERLVEEAKKLQVELLRTAVDYVREGGLVLYSTCTLTVEENEEVVEEVLEEGRDLELVERGPRIGLPGLKGLSEAQRLYPHVHDTLGFFLAVLRKAS